ncbi:MAG: hypothetical protein KAR00_02850 [Candidatus Pacebacteria bacterium]|nr:hypothetical protein [Candidatus Paceibacterota bacterium]
MKKIYVVICVALLIFFVIGCEERPELVHEREERQRARNIKYGIFVIKTVEYIKDPRTNICFAYSWGGQYNGGQALSTVPCEAIPPELLTVAK